jgi:hypothetical protein
MNKRNKTQRIFYLKKFIENHDSPLSLSYNNIKSQNLRFEKINKLFSYEENGAPFSIHEIGSGLAHYYEYIKNNKIFENAVYSGSDIVPDFIEFCDLKYPNLSFKNRDITETLPDEKYDYLMLSGTFNPILDSPIQEWETFIHSMIKSMFAMSKKGIAFNFITSYSDYNASDLYYCDPKKMINFVVNNLSRFFLIDSAYPLYEFTVCVYKKNFLNKIYNSKEFDKYFL